MSLVPSDSLSVSSSQAVVPSEPHQSVQYKQWVLFVRDGDAGSMEALKHIVAIENECLVRDVDSMPSRPEWLTAVPTLLHVPNKRKYQGSAAIRQLQKHVSDEPLGYGNVTKQYYSFGDWGGPARANDFILPTVARDERYEATQPLSTQDIESYIAIREQQNASIKPAHEEVKRITLD